MSDLPIIFREIRRLIVFTILLLIAAAAAILFVWYAWRVLFLAFAGLLLAIILHSYTKWIERVAHLSPKLAYSVALSSIVVACGLAAWLLVPRIIEEAGQIVALIPKSVQEIRESLDKSQWGHYVVQLLQRESAQTDAGQKVANAATKVLDAAAAGVVILVVGFYGALNPVGYANGLLRLVPESRRDLARNVGTEIVHTLRWWLFGQLVPMAVLGILTILGLWALQVPLAFTLGLFTAAMIFIPYAGALISEIPAVLVALKQGPMTMVYVLILYLVVHSLEAYVLTPLVQKKAVRLPPIVTILSEFLLWILTGTLGVAIAAPLAAALLASFRILYLHEKVEH